MTDLWQDIRFGLRMLAKSPAFTVSEGRKLTLLGGVIGIAGALVLTRLMASLLYGITPRDPLTFTGVIVLMLGVFVRCVFHPGTPRCARRSHGGVAL